MPMAGAEGSDDEDAFGYPAEPVDPDDEADESPYRWTEAEWLPDTWVHPEVIRPTREVDRFRRSLAGSIVAGGLLGLEQALEVPKEEAPIIRVQGGEPPKRRWTLDLDPDDPAASVATRRGGDDER